MITNVTVYAKGTETTDKIVLNKVEVYLNLKDIKADSLTYKNVTYIPLRKLSETLGVEVDYDKTNETISLTSGGEVVEPSGKRGKYQVKTADIKLNSVDIYVDGELVEADNIIYNGTTYLPLRAISDTLGLEVKYDSNFDVVYLTTPVKDIPKVDETTEFKPLLTKEDIDYPSQPKTVEDFKKVMLYLANSNIDSIKLIYYGTLNSLFKQSTELYDNLGIAFQSVADEYVDLFSGTSEYRVQANQRDGKVVVDIQLISTMYDDEDLISGQMKFEEEAKEMNDFLISQGAINESMSEKEIAKFLYSFVTVLLEYDMDTYRGTAENNESYTGYGAVFNNKAVCQGYTALYNYMLKLNGIECYGQSGIVDGEVPHIWTVAILDGEKTYIDVTYGDPVPDKKGYTNYKYFDISKEQLSKDRTGVE